MTRQKNFKNSNQRPIYGKIADYVKREKEENSHQFLIICPKCGAIEENKRWFWDQSVKESERKEIKYKDCPGCEAIKNLWIEGEILLKNRITNLIPKQLENMFHNIEEQEMQYNPKNRIVKIKKTKSFWIVYTASVSLAHKIGEELGKTFVSKVSYKFSKGEKFVNVVWEEKN